MLLPRLSLRALLGGMAGCAIGLLIAKTAVTGQAWALGVTVTMGWMLALFLLFGLLFFLSWAFQRVIGRNKMPKVTSPFATDSLPPQIMPPQETS